LSNPESYLKRRFYFAGSQMLPNYAILELSWLFFAYTLDNPRCVSKILDHNESYDENNNVKNYHSW
jgi:hypothetical protein